MKIGKGVAISGRLSTPVSAKVIHFGGTEHRGSSRGEGVGIRMIGTEFFPEAARAIRRRMVVARKQADSLGQVVVNADARCIQGRGVGISYREICEAWICDVIAGGVERPCGCIRKRKRIEDRSIGRRRGHPGGCRKEYV